MAFWSALTGVLRPRPMVQATGAASSTADTTYASTATGALTGGRLQPQTHWGPAPRSQKQSGNPLLRKSI